MSQISSLFACDRCTSPAMRRSACKLTHAIGMSCSKSMVSLVLWTPIVNREIEGLSTQLNEAVCVQEAINHSIDEGECHRAIFTIYNGTGADCWLFSFDSSRGSAYRYDRKPGGHQCYQIQPHRRPCREAFCFQDLHWAYSGLRTLVAFYCISSLFLASMIFCSCISTNCGDVCDAKVASADSTDQFAHVKTEIDCAGHWTRGWHTQHGFCGLRRLRCGCGAAWREGCF